MKQLYSLAIVLIITSCSGKGSFELRLEAAVKDRMLTISKSHKVLAEYDSLLEHDKSRASTYAKRIREILDVGGDSSHVDLVRRQVFRQPAIIK